MSGSVQDQFPLLDELLTGGSTTVFTATTPGQVLTLTSGSNLVFTTTPVTIDRAGGSDIIIASAGGITVNASGGGDVIFDSGGGSKIAEAPSSEYVLAANAATSTITGAAGGSDTISALSGVNVNDQAETSLLFVGGAGVVTVAAAANATLYAGTGGGVYTPGSTGFLLFGGGGDDTIVGGVASPTVWGNTNERLVAEGTAPKGTFIAYGNNDTLNASTAGGDNSFIVVNEALTVPSGTFAGNTTLVGSSAGGDTFAIFREGSAPPAHTITIKNWQASDKFFLGNYSAGDLVVANAALALAGIGLGATFTLTDHTTITFVGNHPASVT